MKLHPLQIIAYLVIAAAGMKVAAPILNLVLMALVFSISFTPVIIWLTKKKVPRGLAILITVLIMIVGTVFLTSVISIAVVRLAEQFPRYQQQLIDLKLQIIQFLSNLGIDTSRMFSVEGFDPNKLMEIARSFVSGIVETFSNFSLVFLMTIFFLIDTTVIRERVENGSIKMNREVEKLYELTVAIRKYVSISAFTGFLTAAGNLVLLLVLGVEYPVLWAFLSFLFSFIPNFGFILSVLAPAFLALMNSGSMTAILVVVGFIVINAIVENVIRPRVMGEELNLSLSIIFISLIFWTWILGALGAILAIPLTISIMKGWELVFSKDKS
jgi:predicted PurR-regulated permease PerM